MKIVWEHYIPADGASLTSVYFINYGLDGNMLHAMILILIFHPYK